MASKAEIFTDGFHITSTNSGLVWLKKKFHASNFFQTSEDQLAFTVPGKKLLDSFPEVFTRMNERLYYFELQRLRGNL